jgi:hypothetical protein
MPNGLIIAKQSEAHVVAELRRRLKIAGPWFGRLKVPRRWSPVPQFPLRRRTLMLPLLLGMGLPLFAVIAYALLSPSPAVAEGAYRDPHS